MARDVLVVGAGPVGLTMALDLTRRGVPCRIVDRLAEPLPYCRAIGVTPRTLEVWEAMDLSDAMIGSGLWLRGMRSVIAGGPAQDAVRPELPIPYAELGIPQYETEAILTRRLMLHGVMPERGMALTALSQDAGGVAVTLSGKAGVEEARFAYVIGCDGAHSTVRHQVGVGFTGDAFPWPFMLGDVHIAEPNALICFAGPRVIQQTIRQNLPEGFQRSEFLLEHGMVDDVIDRREHRTYLGSLLGVLTHREAST